MSNDPTEMRSHLRPPCRVPAGALASDVCPIGSAGRNDDGRDDLDFDTLLRATEAGFRAQESGSNYQQAWRAVVDPALAQIRRARRAKETMKSDCNCHTDADQPRDEKGRFSGSGGSGADAPHMPSPHGLHVMHDPSGEARRERATNAQVAEYLEHGTVNGSRNHSLAIRSGDEHGNEFAESLSPDDVRAHIAKRERGDEDEFDLMGNPTLAARRRRDAATLNQRSRFRNAPRTGEPDHTDHAPSSTDEDIARARMRATTAAEFGAPSIFRSK